MFGLFAPKCPLELNQKAWTEFRMRWLAEQLGIDRLLKAQVVLPTEEFFAGPYGGTEADLRGLLDRVKGYMGVTEKVELEILPNTAMPDANGFYLAGSPARIQINDAILPDPYQVVATLSHELAHQILIGGKLIDPEQQYDHEYVTDLLLIFLGVGIIRVNSSVKEKNTPSYWQISRSGYLTAMDLGYALALFAFARGENDPPWASYLRPDALEVMKKGLRFLHKTGDSIFHPDKLRESMRVPSAAGARDRLNSGTPTEQVVALWQLAENPLCDHSVIEAISAKLADREWAIASAAADALASLGEEAGDTLPLLLKALSACHANVRATAARAIGAIAAQPERSIPALTAALDDTQPVVLVELGRALARFGPQAGESLPKLLHALDAALYRTSGESCLPYLTGALMEIDRDAETRVREFYEDGNDEHRDHVLEIMQDLRDEKSGTVGETLRQIRKMRSEK